MEKMKFVIELVNDEKVGAATTELSKNTNTVSEWISDCKRTTGC